MSDKLSPCPFCGATDSDDNATQQAGVVCCEFKSPVGRAFRVECQCGSRGPASEGRRYAADLWNRRTLHPADEGSET